MIVTEDDDLDEEDLSLIEENLGISIKRVRKLSTVNLCWKCLMGSRNCIFLE